MISGLTTVWVAGQSVMPPLLAQFGGGKSYWIDLVLIVVMFALAVFVIGRASRRY